MKKKNNLVWIIGIILIIVLIGLFIFAPNKDKWLNSIVTYGCNLSNAFDNLDTTSYCNAPFGFNQTLSLNKESNYYMTVNYQSQWAPEYSINCETTNNTKIQIYKGRWAHDSSGNPINITLPKECYLDGKTTILFEAPSEGFLNYYKFSELNEP